MTTFQRHFTVEEARNLLPEVKSIFHRISEIRASPEADFDDIVQALKASPTNGGGKKSAAYFKHILEINSLINRITKLGIEIKDIDAGLIDFPHIRGNKEVFLCYKMGEETIEFWHDIDAGFAGRQRL